MKLRSASALTNKVPEPVRDWALATLVVLADLLVFSDFFIPAAPPAKSAPRGWLLVIGIANLLILGFRRRFPFGVLVAACAISVPSTLAFGFRTVLVTMTGLGTTTSRKGTRTVVMGALLVAATAVSWIFDEVRISSPENRSSAITILPLMYLIIIFITIGIGRWARFGRERLQMMDERRRAEARQAVADERLRLARELHDIVSHAVTVMVLHAAGARTQILSNAGRAEAAMATVEEVGGRAMNELRRLLGVLRSTSGEAEDSNSLSLPGLEDLEPLVETARGAGLDVVLEESGNRRDLEASVNLAAYRVVQEALTNVTKHVGTGARALVCLKWDQNDLLVEVTDNGEGSGAVTGDFSSGHGLLGLRERVNVAGGELLVEDNAGRGYCIKAKLPVAGPAAAPAKSAALPLSQTPNPTTGGR